MKRKRLVVIAIVVGAFVAIGAGVGITMWNKPHQKVEDAEAATVTAEALSKEYAANEAAANAKYLSKPLSVTGNIAEVTKDQDGSVVVRLNAGDGALSIQCTMRDKKDITNTTGSAVTVTGFCSGNTMFDVLLTDCVIK